MSRKKETIIFRVSEEEKRKLMQLAENECKTLSSYLLQKGLAEHGGEDRLSLCGRIKMFTFLNEIYRKIQLCGNKELIESMDTLYHENFAGGRQENE